MDEINTNKHVGANAQPNESSERVLISFDEAVKFLPKRPTIHTVRNSQPSSLVGASWLYGDIYDALQYAQEIDVTGETAQASGHGLAIEDKHGLLFIETNARTDGGTTPQTN